MGYDRYLTGSAEIKPPLDDKTLAKMQTSHNQGNFPAFPALLLDYFTVEDGGEPDRVEMVDGEITVIEGDRASTLGIGADESANHSDFEEQCVNLHRAVTKAGHTITGSFLIWGEDHGDVSRISFRDGGIFDERPKLLWPDGTQEDIR